MGKFGIAKYGALSMGSGLGVLFGQTKYFALCFSAGEESNDI